MAAGDDTVILRGGNVWVGAHPTPRAAWLLLRDGAIAALGAADDAPPRAASVVDVGGCHVVPGFVDAHTHLTAGAFLPAVGDGSDWRGADEALAAVRAAAARTPAGRWVVFMRVEHDHWDAAVPPTAEALEAAGGGRPVLLAELSLHRGMLSESGLARAGLPSPADPSADVVRGRRGVPTGLVYESAFGRALYRALRDLAADLHDDDHVGLLEREARRHLALGITRAHDPGVPADLVPRLAAVRARTPLRLSWSAGATDGLLAPAPAPADVPRDGGDAPPSVKLFTDGAHRCALCLPLPAVLTATGAALRAALAEGDVRPLAQLAGDPVRLVAGAVHVDWLRLSDRALAATVAGHAAAGHRLRVHAIGNLAVQQTVRALRDAGDGVHATIEHLLALLEDDADRVAAAGVVASVQPGFIPHYGPTLLARGLGGHLRALPVASLAVRGVPIAISSDHPCGPLDPLHNLRLAVHRTMPDGRVLDAREAIERSAALRAATIGGAVAIGLREAVGIAPGEPADLAVCDGDPFAPGTRVIATWIGGHRAWPPAA